MFVSILLQNGVYVRDVEVGVKSLVGYVSGRISYDSEESCELSKQLQVLHTDVVVFL